MRLIILMALLIAAELSAAELPYDFKTLNIAGSLIDVNDKGEIVATVDNSNDEPEGVIRRGRKRKAFRCDLGDYDPGTRFTWTFPHAINDRGQVVGICSDGDSIVGWNSTSFIRNRDGTMRFLNFPGADFTQAQGISNDGGKVTGQVIGPLLDNGQGTLSYRFKCFIWDREGSSFVRFDYPVENTYLDCFGVNKKGQVLGVYLRVTTANETLEHGYFIRDVDGTFATVLPLSHAHEAGPSWTAVDMNENGAILGWTNASGAATIFFYDDGILYDVPMPEGWLLAELGGMSNSATFVGHYYFQVGFDEYYQEPIYELRAFIARPKN